MKTLTSLLISLFCFSFITHASEQSIKVAQVDYSEIDDLLESIVLSRPEHKELAARLKTQKEKNDAAQLKMQKALLSGEKINPLEAASHISHGSTDNKTIDQLCDKLALEVIKKVATDKYQIVLNSSRYNSPVIYSQTSIEDITKLVKQELLHQLPEKE